MSEPEPAVASLAATAAAIRALVSDLSPEEARWKPAADRWSILEVVNHLADEEVEDFRARLDVILHSPDREFTPIDPRGAVTARRYAERDLKESIERFAAERGNSLDWLRSLAAPDWDRTKAHASLGPISARQMLASWVAHDLHHVRQITRLRYERLADRVSPLSLAYAGDW